MSSSTLFPASSTPGKVDTPVTFPPGRARLATNPSRTGSGPPVAMTMGMVLVASLAARTTGVPPIATMRSTWSWTSSAARAGRRSRSPSAERDSNVMFCPSTQPSSRSPCRNGSKLDSRSTGSSSRYPMRKIFVDGCAAAASGARKRPRARVRRHPTVLSHRVMGARRSPACRGSLWPLPVVVGMMPSLLCRLFPALPCHLHFFASQLQCNVRRQATLVGGGSSS